MNAIVFLGPTLPLRDAKRELNVEFRGPAALGDVWRAGEDKPLAIGIIDGYFDHTPSPWHKELLWVMSNGIAAFGSASMGALRAAELEQFGMIGVGSIYEAFSRGNLLDDDEVAIIHGHAEQGFKALSEAMVNIRATLESALGHDILDASTCNLLESIAKRLFYPERDWRKILLCGLATGASTTDLAIFSEWLVRNRVDRKAEDALSMLRTMKNWLSAPTHLSRCFQFQQTTVWRNFVSEEQSRQDLEVLKEIALDPVLFNKTKSLFEAMKINRWDPEATKKLRELPEYPDLARRARKKAGQRRDDNQDIADATRNITEDELLRWFFEERMGGWPQDIAGFLLERNWTSEIEVLDIARREFCYSMGERMQDRTT